MSDYKRLKEELAAQTRTTEPTSTPSRPGVNITRSLILMNGEFKDTTPTSIQIEKATTRLLFKIIDGATVRVDTSGPIELLSSELAPAIRQGLKLNEHGRVSEVLSGTVANGSQEDILARLGKARRPYTPVLITTGEIIKRVLDFVDELGLASYEEFYKIGYNQFGGACKFRFSGNLQLTTVQLLKATR